MRVMKQLNVPYEDIVSVENLLAAWEEFVEGKRGKRDVQEFQLRLMDNILSLHRDCSTLTYRHGLYRAFNISDPKPRNIHKATVRDRLLHHAISRKLYLYFDKRFIHDSYSCRLNKGTHKATERFKYFARKISANNTKTCWVLKCDVRKFFASVDHEILLRILARHNLDADLLRLLRCVIESFETAPGKGLPLGNLTSQLLVNIYMNEFDQWVKHMLKAKHYIRYADDFVLLFSDKTRPAAIFRYIETFLWKQLRLSLHPDKVSVQTLASGVDFLGWVHFPDHRVLRTTTKRRMENRLSENTSPETRQSYLGLLSHGNAWKLRQKIG